MNKFWDRVDKSGECWVYAGPRLPYGYGVFYMPPERYAHRVAWTLVNGPIPPKMLVLHHCDNPPCVNPDHLFLGTSKDNSMDMASKGRSCHGDKSVWAKLSRKQIHTARCLFVDGKTCDEIGVLLGVCGATISNLLCQRTWRYVEIAPATQQSIAVRRKRMGTLNGNAKLTAEDVHKIREAYIFGKRGHGACKLGKLFGISKPTVYAILSGKTWTHV